jgi:YkoP domain
MSGSGGSHGLPAAGRDDLGRVRRSVAPVWLDPIMALAEAVDRRRRRIRPIRNDGVLALEIGRHRGTPVTLRDGTVVQPGAPIGFMHLRNDRVRDLASGGWQVAGYRAGRADLAALAGWWESQPPAKRPVAFTATTILSQFARRDGWQVRTRQRTWRARLDVWWMSWLMVHFAKAGRQRLARPHGPLDLVEVWLSASELVARYGGKPPA